MILDSLKITNISKKKLKLPETLRSHGKNNVRKTGGKPSNRREEIREQKARGERNKRKRKGYKHSK